MEASLQGAYTPTLRLHLSAGLPSTRETEAYWRESGDRPWRTLRDGSTSATRRGWASWDSPACLGLGLPSQPVPGAAVVPGGGWAAADPSPSLLPTPAHLTRGCRTGMSGEGGHRTALRHHLSWSTIWPTVFLASACLNKALCPIQVTLRSVLRVSLYTTDKRQKVYALSLYFFLLKLGAC